MILRHLTKKLKSLKPVSRQFSSTVNVTIDGKEYEVSLKNFGDDKEKIQKRK